MDALVQTLTDELYSYLDIPFVLYGHSMGGKICYAWACHLRQQHNLVPDYFFVSAQYAPHLSPRQASIHHLPDAQFLDSLFRLGGTAAAVMQNKELMELMLPLLRADFRLYETYIPMPTEPFACPISAFYGEQDHLVSAEELAAWQLHTHNTFTLRGMPGNHFFIHSAQKQILSAISQDLRGLLSMA
jgi:medium-chain acyl-[acyl-carrier-protein] hydrolase